MPVTPPKFGYHRDVEDARDRPFGVIAPTLARLGSGTGDYVIPERTPISNQGALGSCVANATADALELLQPEGKVVQLSRLFVYYQARLRDGNVCADDGTYVRSAFASLQSVGVCPEDVWPYVEDAFSERPTLAALEAAYDYRIDGYYRIASRGRARLNEIEAAVRADHPVVFGTDVSKAFTEYGSDGPELVWSTPSRPIGGHAMVIVGVRFVPAGRCFVLRNSWGRDWGRGGYALASEAWLSDPCSSDFWVPTYLPARAP